MSCKCCSRSKNVRKFIVFILKKRFVLFEHVVSIPFSRMIISTKPGNEMTTGNYGIEWNNFRNRSIVL